MLSWVIVLALVVGIFIFVISAYFGMKYRKRYLAHLRKRSRKKWKLEHQKSLRGNFVLTYDTPIEDAYYIQKGSVLGQGSFGIVVLGKHKETGNEYAIKFINKNSEERKRLERELRLLKDVDHPNIIGLFAVYDTDDQVGFVMELCVGGHLGRFLEKQPGTHLSEDRAKILIQQLLSAITHMHNRGICHRDIKLQNILMESGAPDAQIKLIDFGFGTRFIGATPLRTRCGTPYTTAPEVFRESYDERCDVWSAGVVAYIVICGRRPFESLVIPGELEDAGKTNLVTNILLCRYHFNHRQWKRVSPLAIDFVQKMMHPDYKSRWSASAALEHEWIDSTENVPSEVTSGGGMHRVMGNLRRASSMSSLHLASMLAVVFSQPNAFHGGTDELRTLFQNFDKDHNGTLSKEEFVSALRHMSPEKNISQEVADKLFDTIDANHDKQISFSEFLAATLDPREVQINQLNKAFELLDLEKKGFITVEDLARVLDATHSSKSHRKLSRSGSHSYNRDGASSRDQDPYEEKRDKRPSKTGFDMFGFANPRIPEGGSMLSVEDSDFSHSQQDLSTTHKYARDKRVEGQWAKEVEEDDDEDEPDNVDVKLGDSRIQSRRASLESHDAMDPTVARRINDILQTCDTNGDGVISYSEFLWAMADGDGVFNAASKSDVDSDSDNDDENAPPPMLKRRGSSMPNIKQDEEQGKEDAAAKNSEYKARRARRNSTASSSLNIHHVDSFGEGKSEPDSPVPFGSPGVVSLLRQNSGGSTGTGLLSTSPSEQLSPGPSFRSPVIDTVTVRSVLEGEVVASTDVRREEESKVVDEEMGSIFPSESAGVLGSVDSGHNTNADISSQNSYIVEDGSRRVDDLSSNSIRSSFSGMFKSRRNSPDVSFCAIPDGLV